MDATTPRSLAATLSPDDALAAAALVDAVADEFEDAWQSGQRPLIEAFLSRVPPHAEADALHALILLDIEYRRQSGEQPTMEAYRARFPRQLSDPGGAPTVEADGEAAAWAYREFDQVGRYIVLSRLAREGQGEVYRAVHPLGMQVVLKFPKGDPGAQEVDELAREARILSQLRHPHIAPVLDIDTDGKRWFVVIQYIHGQNLEQYIAARDCSFSEMALLCARIARAVAAAHAVGVAHLDIKPRNIVIDHVGEPHLIDFGAARVLGTAAAQKDQNARVIGTAPFMSPEQAKVQVDRIGPRSDIFGMGAVLYYLMNRCAPFEAPTQNQALARAREADYSPISASAPQGLARICQRAMASDPSQRHPNMEALAEELERFARPAPSCRLRVAAVVVCALVAAAVGLFVWMRSAPTVQRLTPEQAVSVWQAPAWQALERTGGPLRLGDPLRISVRLPAGVHAGVFLVDAQGAVHRLGERSADAADRLLVYPEGDQGMAIGGSAGNYILLTLTHPSQPVTHQRVLSMLSRETWPSGALPHDLLLTMSDDAIDVVRRSITPRGHQLVTVHAPEALLRNWLDDLRRRAVEAGYGIAATATALQPAQPNPAPPAAPTPWR